jgi:feruloyl-CoA synthase
MAARTGWKLSLSRRSRRASLAAICLISSRRIGASLPAAQVAPMRKALSASAPAAGVLAAPAVRDFFQRLVDSLWASGTGSATRVARALVLTDPPNIDLGEVTDKGSINQRAVLTHRDALVQQLYSGNAPALLLPRR